MSLIIGVIFFIIIMGSLLVYSWANSIHSSQREYQYQQSQFKKSSDYIPLKRKGINSKSDDIILLQYKLQNEAFRERMLSLGIFYFGLYHIWGANANEVDPQKLAEAVKDQMPWVMDEIQYSTLSNYNVTPNYFQEPTQYQQYIEATSVVNNFDNPTNDQVQHYMFHQQHQTDCHHEFDPLDNIDSHERQHQNDYQFVDDPYDNTEYDFNNNDIDPIDYKLDQYIESNQPEYTQYQTDQPNVQHDMNFFPFFMNGN